MPGTTSLLDKASLFADLTEIGLAGWTETLGIILDERLAEGVHGHLEQWRQVIDALPGADRQDVDPAHIQELLLQLVPWRKGPFTICDITIDAEWRSDLKWGRLAKAIAPLDNRNVLDVGCGNGYYALRMLDAGAAHVIGIDPSLLFVCQFLAIRKLTRVRSAHVLPLRLEDLPAGSQVFDTTFSMGVLYHRRNPAEHLEQLRDTLRQGGELILETLILPGGGTDILEPDGRYARMRNVWQLPTTCTLLRWLKDAGFVDTTVVDETATSTEEQRTTDWMPFESLAEALDPDEPALTIEGLPAPVRAIVTARAP